MKNNDVIIVGAGISGLLIARQLSRAGLGVTILEARNRIGGRIHTIKNSGFIAPVETGAEFIHGNLKNTMDLLKEYNLSYSPAKGKIIQTRRGELEKDKDFVPEHHRELEARLKALKRDMPLKKFLDAHFKDIKYLQLRLGVIGFVEGYESADLARFSTFAFREDWLKAEEWEQYRVNGGYGKLVQALADECKKNGCTLHLSSPVKKITWKKNAVQVTTVKGKIFTSEKIVITVPLGILLNNSISFSPGIPGKIKTAKQLGYGDVIKVLLLFKTKFWESKKIQKRLGENFEDLFFLFSKAPVPTWWTQSPSSSGLLTGWLSGTAARNRKLLTDKKIFEEAIYSLALIFDTDTASIKKMLKAWKVVNWSAEEFTQGSYSYATVNAKKFIDELGKPLKDTLFFAGEVFSEEGGTVEAALISGYKTAYDVLSRRGSKPLRGLPA